MNSDIRDTIISLAIRADNGDKQASRDLDHIISKIEGVSRLSLFLKRIANKDCIKTLKRLVNGKSVNEQDLSLAISSLLTQSLLELSIDPTLFKELQIREQVTVLNEFIKGEIDTIDVLQFYKDFLYKK